ncbi:intraflagellar transport protein 57-like [Histomonas meleagridis]|uniref:intraflagellar transport protein 57-like n=1 Tax=Histomonas meleagridis TaxID=135588 RepID=UPI00355A18A7|nr:intraflagellar transport protein 57-like [Histomonas meleagridis]
MRQIYDALQYLNYETEFDPIKRHLPYLTPFYFALPAQSSKEQFDYFASLSIWLMQTYHHSDIATPSDYDEPSSVADNLMVALPSLGFKLNFSSSKLLPGHGIAVCTILDAILRLTLKRINFSPAPFRAISGFGGEEEVQTIGDSDDDGIIDDAIDIQEDAENNSDDYEVSDHVTGIPRNTIDSVDLKSEAERVASRLQIRIPTTKTDWRSHFSQMSQHHKSINEINSQLSPILTKVGADVTKAIQAIETREKNLNNRFEISVSEYAEKATALSVVEARHREKVAIVNELQEELKTVANNLNSTKESLNEKQKEVSDNTPLMKIKMGITKLKDEVKSLELQSAILQRSLIQSWLEENELAKSSYM